MNKKIITLSTIAMLSLSGCGYITTVDSSEVAVVKTAGVIEPNVLREGFAVSVNPMSSLNKFNIKQRKLELSAKSAAVVDTNDVIYDAPIIVLTKERLQIPIDMTIMYNLKPEKAADMLKNFGEDIVWDDKIVGTNIRNITRGVIGDVSIGELISNRDKYEKEILTAMNAITQKNGVTIHQVMVRDIGIPTQIQDSVKQKMIAEQNAEKAKFDVEKAKQDAQVEIERQKGVAEANKHLTSSLSPQLIEYKRLQMEQMKIEKWNGVNPATLMTGGTIPTTTMIVK